MKSLSLADYHDLARDAQVLSRDEHGEKVLLTPDGRVIKLFRRKRWVSSAWIVPYAARFAQASRRLQARGIRSVAVESVYRIPALGRHAVVYPMLPGTPVRTVPAESPPRGEELLTKLADLLATLHQRGVYFRAMHFGNVLVCDDRGDGGGDRHLALIDISETRFGHGPLSPVIRARNFRPLLSYPEDAMALTVFGLNRLVMRY